MPAFECHLFVCCNQRDANHPRGCCDPTGQEALKDKFKTELKKRKLGPLFRVNSAGCLDQCESGPVVVLYPQAIWYGGVTPDDVERILDETVIGGRVIEELRIPDERLNCPAVKGK